MEFGFTEEQEKLRKEVHDFFENELPEDHNSNLTFIPIGKELEEHRKLLDKKVVDKGWATAGWPKKYGGLGMGPIEQAVVQSEMMYWGVGTMRDWAGYALAAPTILSVGTEEQKARFIPPIAQGKTITLECFTEPDAGSDEANVQLRAVPDGDYFVLNGQKTFISGEFKPDWLYTLAKTADVVPKHKGISLFMVPGDAPGITYRPLPTMGGSMQNEVFYDNVRVHKTNMIGELNRGFYAAMATLEFERASGGGPGVRRSMAELVEFCQQEKRNGKPLIEDPQVREMLAQMAIETEISWLAGWYGAWRSSQRQKLGWEPYSASLLYRRHWQVADGKALMRAFGLYGQLKPDSKYAKYDGAVQRRWEVKHSIHDMGTPEIQKMVIATRGLGLPRIPRQFNTMINEALKGEGK